MNPLSVWAVENLAHRSPGKPAMVQMIPSDGLTVKLDMKKELWASNSLYGQMVGVYELFGGG